MTGRVNIQWSDLWAMLREMSRDSLVAIGRELNGDDFVRWIHSRSPKTQIEILEAAPESLQGYLYSKNVISPVAISMLGIHGKRIATIDRRK